MGEEVGEKMGLGVYLVNRNGVGGIFLIIVYIFIWCMYILGLLL